MSMADTLQPKRTYCYLRVSTDMQDVDSQRVGICDFCAARGWEIDGWCEDEGVSGAVDPSRRKLGGLLRRCQPGDRLVFGEISRIGRKLVMILDFIRECTERGVKVYTVKDRYVLEDTIQSKVLITVMGLAAEIERDLLRQRTMEGLRRAVAAGKVLGRPRGSVNRTHKVDDAVLEKVKISLSMGFSLQSIARKIRVNRATLHRAMSARRWRHDGQYWRDETGEIIAESRTRHAYHPPKDKPPSLAERLAPYRQQVHDWMFRDGLTIRELTPRLSALSGIRLIESQTSRLINHSWKMNRPNMEYYDEQGKRKVDGMGLPPDAGKMRLAPEDGRAGGDGGPRIGDPVQLPAVVDTAPGSGHGDAAPAV